MSGPCRPWNKLIKRLISEYPKFHIIWVLGRSSIMQNTRTRALKRLPSRPTRFWELVCFTQKYRFSLQDLRRPRNLACRTGVKSYMQTACVVPFECHPPKHTGPHFHHNMQRSVGRDWYLRDTLRGPHVPLKLAAAGIGSPGLCRVQAKVQFRVP